LRRVLRHESVTWRVTREIPFFFVSTARKRRKKSGSERLCANA
jgi:hypothetical protein